jgi:hypothetical protein
MEVARSENFSRAMQSAKACRTGKILTTTLGLGP